MTNLVRLLFFLLLLIALGFFLLPEWHPYYLPPPAPTESPRFSEEDGLVFKSREWWALIHRTAPGTDWRRLEYQTQIDRHREKKQRLSLRTEECKHYLVEADLEGEWQEKGSTNQAGSVFRTAYDPATDEIWLISAGGSLWKGKRNGSEWTVVNQDLQFDPILLQFIPHLGRQRLLASVAYVPHYSDDRGLFWEPAAGIEFHDSEGRSKDPTVVNENLLYLLVQEGSGENIRLMVSEDGSQTFHPVATLPLHDLDRVSLFHPFHAARPLLASKDEAGQLQLAWINPAGHVLEDLPAEKPLSTGVIPVNLTGWHTDTLSRWYSYVEQNQVLRLYRTEDQGKNWQLQGTLPAVPWEVGIKVSPTDPNLLFLGEVECFRSRNGGKDWSRINPWYAYYRDINNNLHADMMHFGAYQTSEQTNFMIISHHGGISYSEDDFVTMQNLSLEGLHITQYYDTRTAKTEAELVYAGSQDQGLQFNRQFDHRGPLPLEQVLPGDYEHLAFTRNGKSLWAVSPGGWVVWMENPTQAAATASWTLPNFTNAVWFPPLVALSDTTKNVVLLGGGNTQQADGSFLIKLEGNNNKIEASKLPFDFKQASQGGLISALGVSPLHTGFWYAATTNGYFFSSSNQGQSWQPATPTGPNAGLFYSMVILPSPQDSTVVYWGGNGYDQPAVFRSTDGGKNFMPFAEGLPPTMVFDLAANEDGSLLFAATQSGPYVYSRQAGRWFDLAAACTPIQYFMSVEYLAGSKTARFSTFGRGIWDYRTDPTVDAAEPLAFLQTSLRCKVFPNPSSGRFNLELPADLAELPAQLRLFNAKGQAVLEREVDLRIEGHRLEWGAPSLAPGIYWLSVQAGKRIFTRKIVVIK